MVPEDLLFWIAPLGEAPTPDPSVLCRRHADAMVVPRGWTLDDRREPVPRLFKPRDELRPKARRTRPRLAAAGEADGSDRPEQLQIDGTGEIPRPAVHDEGSERDEAVLDVTEAERSGPDGDDAYEPWQPDFDVDDDLGGLLEVKSPLLARAFRGTDRPRT
jgi:hypothetical protein